MIPVELVEAPLLVVDLDGTLYAGDSLRDFLAYVARRRALRSAALARAVLGLARSLRRHGRPGRRRELLLAALLEGCSPNAAETLATEFTAGPSRERLRASLVACVHRRRERGATTILASGSPDLYVRPLVQDVPFQRVLATRTQLDRRGVRVLDDPLVGAAKLAAVEEAARDLGFGAEQTAAIADHHLDLELLAWTRWPFVIEPTAELAAIADHRGWTILDARAISLPTAAPRPREDRGRA